MSAASSSVDAGRRARGEQVFREVMTFGPPCGDSPVSDGLIDFVFGEIWPRPGLGLRERRLITLACTAFQAAATPVNSQVYAALKSGDVSFAEMDEVVLHLAAYYGWPRASFLNAAIAEQKQRVLAESAGA